MKFFAIIAFATLGCTTGLATGLTPLASNTRVKDALLALQAASHNQRLNRSQLATFKEILASGVPSEAVVGRSAIESIGPLLLASTADEKFQQHILGELQARIGVDVDNRGYAFLNDSVSIEHGQAEDYGGVLIPSKGKLMLPVELDERDLDQSRDSLGLGPIALEVRTANDLLATGASMQTVAAPPALFTTPVALTRPELRADLDRRFKRDQDLRTQWQRSGEKISSPEGKAVVMSDADNKAAIIRVFDHDGFPTPAMVGRHGITEVFTIVQHSVDLPLMRRALLLARPLMLRGDMPRGEYAFMVDRLLILEKKEQLYGSQARSAHGQLEPFPIMDEGSVGQRRDLMRLQTLKFYYNQLNASYP